MKYTVAVLLFSIALPLRAQPKYVIQWADTLNNGSDDDANGIAVDGSGNIYVTGYFYNGSNWDCLTVKYDSSGNIVWEDTLDNGSSDGAHGVAVDGSGNIYITGSSNNGSDRDYLTVKYDSSGNILWERTIDNNDDDKANGIAVDDSGNVYVTGESYNGSNYDYLTVKYDSSGNIVWVDTLDNGNDDLAEGIAVDGSGNVYVTGESHIGSNWDCLTLKYDASGNIVWADTLDNGSAHGIAVDKSGNVYITGSSYNGLNSYYLTVKYDASGNITWEDTLVNGSNNDARGIAVDGSGNVYVTGESYIGSNWDYLTVKYDASGNIVWADTLDNGNSDHAYGIAVDGNGDVYVTGESNNGSNFDYLTIKYVKNKDVSIISIVSPDTANADSTYIPEIRVRNNSYEDTLSFDISAYIDSSGTVLYADTQYVFNLAMGDSVLVNFAQWIAPSSPMTLTLKFSILTADMNADNDTMSQALYITDLIPPVIDSAIASDGANAANGVDNDDYVVLYFSEPTNKPIIYNSNINSVLSLSGGHSWLDGAGNISSCVWNSNGDQLQINFTTDISQPTIAVGDTITPDDVTITDISGNPCSSPIVLKGNFDMEPPVIDSAIAYDGTNAVNGIDNDDYVVLYFSEPTNRPTIDNSNINSVLSLSGGHSWLDGFGTVGSCIWNPDGTQLLINLTTNTSLPTIAVGDTIKPDSVTITDLVGNLCSSPVILGGSFDPSGINDTRKPRILSLSVSGINRGKIAFTCGIPDAGDYSISLYSIDGRIIRKIQGTQIGYHKGVISGLRSGIYFLKLRQGKKVITKRVIVEK